MRVGFYDHRGLGRPYAAALAAAGHTITPAEAVMSGHVLLIDNDALIPPHVDFFAAHERAFLYPHGGGAMVPDGMYPPHPKTLGRFVVGVGQLDVLAASGDMLPAAVTGWPWCPLAPFQPREPRRILFAPIHADFHGWQCEATKAANTRAFDLLCALPGRQVTVRTVFAGPAAHGIEYRPGVLYEQGEPVIDPEVFAGHDLIVGAGTIHAVAVACGRPAVIYGQDLVSEIRDARDGVSTVTVGGPSAALDAACYPYDLLRGGRTDLLLDRAASVEAVDWRCRFIGAPFDPARFVTLFEEAVRSW